jgi:hypothetical protein
VTSDSPQRAGRAARLRREFDDSFAASKGELLERIRTLVG